MPLNKPSWRGWLARNVYVLLLRLGTPAYLWRVWSRGREEPGYRARWPERLGFGGERVASGGPVVWVHAVSLGEARAAEPLVHALRATVPGMRLLLTHTTATGREAGQRLLQAGDAQVWLPYDTPGAVRRFLRRHRPAVGVLMETEVWPTLQHEAAKAAVPMVLANARLSAKSLRQGQRFAALLRPAAQGLTMALAQTPDDAERLRQMGAPDVRVMGNVKYDMTPAPAMLALGQQWAGARAAGQAVRPLVLAASTREGEEPALLEAWRAQQAAMSAPAPRLFIVPRHPQRFDEVAALVQAQGLILSRRSTWADGVPDAQAQQADVWLGDSMGEMPAYYAAAHVALLGGSFQPLGGQNLIEAAACACPIVMGPSTFNFAEAAELSLEAGSAFRVQDWAAGVARSVALVRDPAALARARASALAFSQAHRGAAQRMAEAIAATVQGRAQA